MNLQALPPTRHEVRVEAWSACSGYFRLEDCMNFAAPKDRRRTPESRAWLEPSSGGFKVQSLKESRFLAGRQGLPSDASFVLRLGVQLITRSWKLGSLGPSVLVLGRAPSGWSWKETLALARAMGGWCAAQGFAVLTLGETGLSEALARSCERFGGRAVRCVLEGEHVPSGSLAFGSELARRIAVAKLARATLALSPSGEAPGMLLFLHALSRFERLPSRPTLVLGAAQWEFSDDFPDSTQPIENLEDLARALELE